MNLKFYTFILKIKLSPPSPPSSPSPTSSLSFFYEKKEVGGAEWGGEGCWDMEGARTRRPVIYPFLASKPLSAELSSLK